MIEIAVLVVVSILAAAFVAVITALLIDRAFVWMVAEIYHRATALDASPSSHPGFATDAADSKAGVTEDTRGGFRGAVIP